jgi:hypothetical protein
LAWRTIARINDAPQVGGLPVLWISCKASNEPVYLDKEHFYVRSSPSTDELTGKEQFNYIKRRFLGGSD